MPDPWNVWISRKKSRRVWRLRTSATVSGEHKRVMGARSEFGGVVLAATPADYFSFVSRAAWPDRDDYTDAVCEAALDALLCTGPYNATGVSLSLEDIKWHHVDSCAVAFYCATRSAMEELAAFDEFGFPENFEPVSDENSV